MTDYWGHREPLDQGRPPKRKPKLKPLEYTGVPKLALVGDNPDDLQKELVVGRTPKGNWIIYYNQVTGTLLFRKYAFEIPMEEEVPRVSGEWR